MSFGGFLAYEIAQQLQEAGGEVSLLALLDSSWPDAVTRSKAAFVKNALRKIKEEGAGPALQKAGRMIAAGAGADRSHVTMRAGAIDLQEARAVAFRSIVKRSQEGAHPYAGPALIFRALDREIPAGYVVDEKLGWPSLLTDHLTIQDVPGSHLGILEEPNVARAPARRGRRRTVTSSLRLDGATPARWDSRRPLMPDSMDQISGVRCRRILTQLGSNKPVRELLILSRLIRSRSRSMVR